MMDAQVHVGESDVFTRLARFLEDVARANIEDSREARRIIVRTLEQLHAYERQVSAAIGHWQGMVEGLEAEYNSCEEDCGDLADELDRARAELARVEALHELVLMHGQRIQEASETFLREQSALVRMLESDTAHGIVQLGQFRQQIVLYAAVSGETPGVFGSEGSVSPAGSGPESIVGSYVDLTLKVRDEADQLWADAAYAETVSLLEQYKVYNLDKGLNAYLRTGEPNQPYLYGPDPVRVERSMWLMNRPFGRYQLDTPATLHRCVSAADVYGAPKRIQQFDDLVAGSLCPERAFVSTSLHPDKVQDFLRHKDGYYFRIEAVAGLSYIPMTKNEEGLYEDELLLPPGTVFYVTAVSDSTEFARGYSVRVIDAIAFPPGTTRASTSDPRGEAGRAWNEWAATARLPAPDPLEAMR